MIDLDLNLDFKAFCCFDFFFSWFNFACLFVYFYHGKKPKKKSTRISEFWFSSLFRLKLSYSLFVISFDSSFHFFAWILFSGWLTEMNWEWNSPNGQSNNKPEYHLILKKGNGIEWATFIHLVIRKMEKWKRRIALKLSSSSSLFVVVIGMIKLFQPYPTK